MPRTKLSLDQIHNSSLALVGRESLLSELTDMLNEKKKHSVIVINGMGGIGKTSLVNELVFRLNGTSSQFITAKLDFRQFENRILSRALIRLRSKLKIPFPSFDIAFAYYWKLMNPHISFKNKELQFLYEGEISGDLISLLSEIPFIGFLGKIPRVIDKASRKTKSWWYKRGNIELKSLLGKDEPNEIEEWLPLFWASDLKNWCTDNNKTLILVFDTYEALWEGQNRDSRGLSADDWVREFVAHLDDSKVVISGQGKIDWIDKDDSWKDFIIQKKLEYLSDRDAKKLLIDNGITDDSIIKVILNKSRGLPVFLSQAIKMFNYLRSNNDKKVFSPLDFDFDLGGIVEHFLSFKTDIEKSTLFILSVPRKFDFGLFKELLIEFGSAYPTDFYSFQNLNRLIELEIDEFGSIVFHDSVREVLEKVDDKTSRKQIHKYLFSKFRETRPNGIIKVGDNDVRNSIEEAVYHAKFSLEKVEYDKWFNDVVNRLSEWQLALQLRQSSEQYYSENFGLTSLEFLQNKLKIAEIIYLQGKDYSEAKRILNLIISDLKLSQHTESLCIYSAEYNLANIDRIEGRLNQARQKLEFLINKLKTNERDFINVKCSVYNALSILHETEKQNEKAIYYLEKALDLSKELTIDTDEESLILHLNYALLKSRNSEHEEALKIAQKCYQIVTEWFGHDHPQTLHHKGALKRIEFESGLNQEEVVNELKQLIVLETEILGKGHPQTLDTMSLLANIYDNLGMIEAEVVFRDILEVKIEYLGNKNSGTMFSYLELSNYLWGKKKFDEAEELLQNLSHLAKNIIDNDHPTLLEGKQKLAHIFFDLGMFNKAKSFYEQILSFRRDKLGDSHKLTIEAMVFSGQANGELGELKQAEKLFSEALELRLVHYKDDYSLIAACFNNLALIYKKTHRLNEALDYLKRAYDYELNEHDKDDPIVLTTRENIALLLFDMNEIEKGISILKETLSIRLDKVGLLDRETINCFGNLVNIYKSRYQIDEAEAFFKQIKKYLPSDNLNDLASFESMLPVHLAILYHLSKRTNSAVYLLESFIENTKQKRGLESDLTRIAIEELVEFYQNSSQFDKVPNLCHDWIMIIKNIYGDESDKLDVPLENRIKALNQLGSFKKSYLDLNKLLSLRRKRSDHILVFQTLLELLALAIRMKIKVDLRSQLFKDIETLINEQNIPNSLLAGYYFLRSIIEEFSGLSKESENHLVESFKIASESKFEDKYLKIQILLRLYQLYHHKGMLETSNRYYSEAFNEAKVVSKEALELVRNSKITLGNNGYKT